MIRLFEALYKDVAIFLFAYKIFLSFILTFRVKSGGSFARKMFFPTAGNDVVCRFIF